MQIKLVTTRFAFSPLEIKILILLGTKLAGKDALELPVLVLLLNCLRAQPLTKITLKLCNTFQEITIFQSNNIII